MSRAGIGSQTETGRTFNRVLTALVIVTIVLVAYWGVNGGLDQIVVEVTTTSVTSG